MSTDSSRSSVPAGRRFWVTVGCFFVLNCLAWVVFVHIQAGRHRGTLRVEAFEPGDNAVVDSRSPLRWHFSDDVIPTTAYGKEPGRVSPAVAGRWAWENPRTLAFVPAVDLPRATPVTFTLAADLLRTGSGAALNQPYVACVRSTPLAVKAIRQSGAIDDDQFVLDFAFNDRVTPGDVLEHAQAALANGQAVHLRVYGQAAGETVRLATESIPTDSEADSKLTVKLLAGLTGLSGPLGLAEAHEETIVVERKLVATGMTAIPATREQSSLQIAFNNGIETAVLKEVLSIDPPVPFTIESPGGNTVNLVGDFQPGKRYTARIAALPAGASALERALAPRPAQLAAFMPDRGSDLWFDHDEGYLSTAGNRSLLVHAVNIAKAKVSVTRMYDSNLVVWRNAGHGSSREVEEYSKPVAERTINVGGPKNVQQDVPIVLDDLLPAGSGGRAGVWRVSIERVAEDGDANESTNSDQAVVTLSDIGLTAKKTRDGMVAWATSLHTAAPLENVRVRAYSDKNQLIGQAMTNADGLARLTELHPAAEESVAVLLADVVPVPATQATSGPVGPSVSADAATTELTWLDLRRNNWELGDSDVSGAPYLRTGLAAFAYTDRGVYRPGETVHLRAVVRAAGNIAPVTASPVKWQLRRPDQQDWKSQTVMLDSDGGAAADIVLPADLPTGMWSASLMLPGADKKNESIESVDFQLEDFIPNRLKVSLAMSCVGDNEPARYLIGDNPLEVRVQGDYLFGRPGAGLALDLSSTAARVPFSPTGWAHWAFGDTAGIARVASANAAAAQSGSPHVRSRHRRHVTAPQGEPTVAAGEQAPETAALDEHGTYRGTLSVAEIVRFSADGDADEYRGPWLMTTQAGVREAGGRAVTVSRQIQVDALPAYIGLRCGDGRRTVRPGEVSEFTIKLVKPDGAPANETDADLPAELVHETWNTVLVNRDGHYHYDSTRVLNPVASTTVHVTQGVGSWSVTLPDSGEYVLKVADPATGAMTSLPIFASDGTGWNENVDRQIPDRLEVRLLSAGEDESSGLATGARGGSPAALPHYIGDTARVLVASPFAGRLLLSVETDDVVSTQVIDMKSSHVIVPVTVTDACWPNAFISATVIRGIDPNAKWQTHRAFGVTRLPIDSQAKQLQIALSAPELIRPLQSLDVIAKVTDGEGNPVANAAINLAAVDEGICSLTGFASPDPLKFFASRRALGVESSDLYGLLMPEVVRLDGQHAVGGDATAADMGGRYRSPVGARRVKPVALAWTLVHSDADGIARGSFSVPPFQGRLRIMAVGYTPRLLGSADRGVTVRSPILAQSSWPRFAAPGDRFTVPVVLFNNTDAAGGAVVSAQLIGPATGLMGFGDKAAPQIDLSPVTLPAGEQRQVNLDVRVGQAVGVARVQISVTLGSEFYHEDVEIPVRPASPMTQFGGVMTASTTQPAVLGALTAMMPGTGLLHVSVTPWPTLNLPKGLEYLDDYPYGCCEQTTSVCFPLVALGDVGRSIDPVRFDPQRIKEKVEAGITRLIGMQTADGGLAMWQGETEPWPWGSVYAAHFLTEAKAAGYDVPGDFFNHLLAYVHRLTDDGTDDASQLEIQSYAEYVLTAAGRPDRTALDRLTELSQTGNRPDDPVDGYCMRDDARLMLASAWLLAGRRDLAEGLMPDAVPLPRKNRQADGNLGSPIRDQAILILAMEQVQPDRAELVQLVQQLADAGVRGEWASTQDTAFSCLAIGRYLRAAHARTAYESARLVAGDAVLGQAGPGGSIAWTADESRVRALSRLRVELGGPTDADGYVSWLQTGVPMAPPKDAEHGLKIHRRYLAMNGQELHGIVTSGDLVRVELTIEAPPESKNLVIEDLLPAGLEVENPRLETAAKDPASAADASAEPVFGDGRADVRDDRVIIPGRMPSAWKAHCTYLARAVTPGVYTVPPVRAEAMYDLNENAISGAGKLSVLPVEKVIAVSAQ